MSLPAAVSLTEVGPREGFQFEGIGCPDKIATADKIDLVDRLSLSGMRRIEIASFVHPRLVPQMADAEEICRSVTRRPGVEFTGIYLNDRGLQRAMATGCLAIAGNIILTASETFSLRNQKRDLAADLQMQRRIAGDYRKAGIEVSKGTVMAAFGCNWEGEIPLDRLLSFVRAISDLADEHGGGLRELCLADTMGWADPELVRRTIGAVRNQWPDVAVSLHLHDTRGLAIANVYAALLEGVTDFDCAVGGLGGCPFAGHQGAAGNVCSEEVVFLCNRLGIDTGVDLDVLVECAKRAEQLVGHPLPSKMINASRRPLG